MGLPICGRSTRATYGGCGITDFRPWPRRCCTRGSDSMKFSLSWLKTQLQTSASLQEITDTLTRIGLELEGVEDRGAALASFRIAHVVEAVQHPNADRLRACRVDTGEGIVSVVCGAPNARTGMKSVSAAPGSFKIGR